MFSIYIYNAYRPYSSYCACCSVMRSVPWLVVRRTYATHAIILSIPTQKYTFIYYFGNFSLLSTYSRYYIRHILLNIMCVYGSFFWRVSASISVMPMWFLFPYFGYIMLMRYSAKEGTYIFYSACGWG